MSKSFFGHANTLFNEWCGQNSDFSLAVQWNRVGEVEKVAFVCLSGNVNLILDLPFLLLAETAQPGWASRLRQTIAGKIENGEWQDGLFKFSIEFKAEIKEITVRER